MADLVIVSQKRSRSLWLAMMMLEVCRPGRLKALEAPVQTMALSANSGQGREGNMLEAPVHQVVVYFVRYHKYVAFETQLA